MTHLAHPQTTVGHIHLKVSNLEHAIDFYSKVLGFEVTQRYGKSAAFLGAGGYHHQIGLNTWESAGGAPAPKRATGLYHVAFLYPDQAALAAAIASVKSSGTHIYGAADHGVSLAVYFDDPDGNGIELYWDRDAEDWPRDTNGELKMGNAPFDIDAFVAEHLPQS